LKTWVDGGGNKNREEYYETVARKIDASKKFRDFRDHGYLVFDPEGDFLPATRTGLPDS